MSSDDIVVRLHAAASWSDPFQAGVCRAAADEIERLRIAGDALAEVVDDWPELVDAWEEARRG